MKAVLYPGQPSGHRAYRIGIFSKIDGFQQTGPVVMVAQQTPKRGLQGMEYIAASTDFSSGQSLKDFHIDTAELVQKSGKR